MPKQRQPQTRPVDVHSKKFLDWRQEWIEQHSQLVPHPRVVGEGTVTPTPKRPSRRTERARR
jgi:hypothetical protein